MAYKTRRMHRNTKSRRNTKSMRKVKWGGRGRASSGDRRFPKIASTQGPTTISTSDYWTKQGAFGRGLRPEVMASLKAQGL